MHRKKEAVLCFESTEFGHKILLYESAEKFITDYEVYEKQGADCELCSKKPHIHAGIKYDKIPAKPSNTGELGLTIG
jgi:hypothetical protein